MKNIILIFAIILVVIVRPNTLRSQDIHFSQFYENAIHRNPALTGIFSGDYKGGVSFRNQWGNAATPFITILGSYETRISVNKEVGDYLSFGLNTTYDRSGSIDFTSFQVMPAVNFNKSLEDKHLSYLSLGFAGGFTQRSVDMGKMTFGNQYVNGAYSSNNPNGENFSFTKVHFFDLSAGLSLNSSLGAANQVNYYLGVAAFHITQPKEAFNENENFIRLKPRWTGNLGVQAILTNNFGFAVHLNYTVQNPYQEWIGGGLLSWRTYDQSQQSTFILYGGFFYRLNDAIIPTIKVEYKNYSFTASYDVNISQLRPATNGVGGFEFSLFARGIFKKNIDQRDQSRCPRFENRLPGFMDN